MAPHPGVHIQEPPAQLRQLQLAGPLALGQAHQGDRLGFAVVQQGPAGIAGQQPAQALPEPGLTVFLEG